MKNRLNQNLVLLQNIQLKKTLLIKLKLIADWLFWSMVKILKFRESFALCIFSYAQLQIVITV